MLQDRPLHQLLIQTALFAQLVFAPAAKKQPSQAAATEQAPEQALVAPELPVPSEPLSARERRQKRQGESLQKLEAEAALQQKGGPTTPQPALPKRQDSFNNLPSRRDSQKSLGSQTSSVQTPAPRKRFPTPGSEENFHRNMQLQESKEDLQTPSPVETNLRIDWISGKSAEKSTARSGARGGHKQCLWSSLSQIKQYIEITSTPSCLLS